MATRKRDIPEAEAERQVYDSLQRLDALRIEELKQVSEEQQWKIQVLRAELERLEPVLTAEHPRLVRIKAQMEHYSASRDAIEVLVKGDDDNEEPAPTASWELSGLVSYQKAESPAGLRVVLEPNDKNLKTLDAQCDANGFYRITVEPGDIRQYRDIPVLLKVYYRGKNPIYTAEQPLFIKEGGQERMDINI